SGDVTSVLRCPSRGAALSRNVEGRQIRFSCGSLTHYGQEHLLNSTRHLARHYAPHRARLRAVQPLSIDRPNLLHQMWLEQLATICYRCIRRDELERRDRDFIAHEDRCARLLRPQFGLAQGSGRLRRKRHAERHPETEIAKGLVFLSRCQSLAELDDADVARIAYHVGERD